MTEEIAKHEKFELNVLRQKILGMKKKVIRQSEAAGNAYVAQGMGAAEILGSLYFYKLKYNSSKLDWPKRDRFILSPGHYAQAVYAAMCEGGMFPEEMLDTYAADGSQLEMISSHTTPGMEVGGGSLAQGLSQGIGRALASKIRRYSWNTYVLISDGELEEGQTWEAAAVASYYKLNNLTVICDVNGVQVDGFTDDVLSLEPIRQKWEAFGWRVVEIDGNNLEEVLCALDDQGAESDKPYMIIARTKFGNGISFLMDRPDVHNVKWTSTDTVKALDELS